MTIARKMNLAVAAIILGFCLSAGVLIASNINSQRINSLNLSARRVIAAMYRLSDSTKDLLVTRATLDVAVAAYDRSYTVFQEAFDDLITHPGLNTTSAEMRETIERSQRVWELLASEFDAAQRAAHSVLEAELPRGVLSAGAVRMRYSLPEGDVRFGGLRLDLMTMESRVQSAAASGSEFIVDTLGKLADEIESHSTAIAARNLYIAVALALLVIIGSLVFLGLFGKSLTMKVRAVEQAMKTVADRDMTVRSALKSSDEFGELGRHVNGIVDSLSEFLLAVRSATEDVDELKDVISSGSTESASALNQITNNISSLRHRFHVLDAHVENSTAAIAAIAHEVEGLSTDIQEQSGAITESSASIEEMTASVRSVAELSGERKRRADQLAEIVRDGGEKIEATNDVIKSISREIGDIQEITAIINEVSEQTNLLSMNAAIESAHAGEAGKGFAVVAEEIRKLAESTSENAGHIGRSLSSIGEKMRSALETSDAGYRAVENIVTEVVEFASAMSEISHSMNELSGGSGEILEATGSISRITENIRTAGNEMTERTQAIMAAMNGAREISAEVVGGMDEIDTGAKEVLASVVDISDKTNQSRERMDVLNSLIGSFKLSADAVATRAPDGTDSPVTEKSGDPPESVG